MKTQSGWRKPAGRRVRRLAAACMCLAAAACSSLLPEPEVPPSLYSLDYTAPPGPPASAEPGGAIVIVTAPRAAPGFDRARMAYLRQPHHLEYFARNQWVDAPPRMLAPLLATALERSGKFRSVLQAPSTAAGQIRLATEIQRLQQEFFGFPSQVRFTLRARLIDEASRQVIATREFEALVGAPSEDPYGGVQAANQAVNQVLRELVIFCAEQARRGPPLGKNG